MCTKKEVCDDDRKSKWKKNFHFDKRPPPYYYTFICIALTVLFVVIAIVLGPEGSESEEKLESYVKKLNRTTNSIVDTDRNIKSNHHCAHICVCVAGDSIWKPQRREEMKLKVFFFANLTLDAAAAKKEEREYPGNEIVSQQQ